MTNNSFEIQDLQDPTTIYSVEIQDLQDPTTNQNVEILDLQDPSTKLTTQDPRSTQTPDLGLCGSRISDLFWILAHVWLEVIPNPPSDAGCEIGLWTQRTLVTFGTH